MDPQQLPLRNYHLPEPVGWWPPAPGWWILATLVLILLFAVWLMIRARRRGAICRAARKELGRIRQAPGLSDQQRIARISILLRRVSVSVFPRTEVAGLTGRGWLQFLDRCMGGLEFVNGPGRILLDAPYRQDSGTDTNALFDLCEKWIRALPRTRPGSVAELPADSTGPEDKHD